MGKYATLVVGGLLGGSLIVAALAQRSEIVEVKYRGAHAHTQATGDFSHRLAGLGCADLDAPGSVA
jgi:hypothetical protein